MEKSVARISFWLYIDCPHCGESMDLLDDHNHEGEMTTPIFSNKWEELEGYKIECDHCGKEFQIEEIEY